jgi:hippurate hydrolase
VPGAYLFLGATFSEDPRSAPNNHSPRATFDDSVLPDGAALLAELALRQLDSLKN